MGPVGLFRYTATLTRAGGGWGGRADASKDPGFYPGLAGERPDVTLGGGFVTLTSTESQFSLRRNPHYREWGPPSSEVTIRVGDAIESIAQEGDRLGVSRGGCAELGVTLVRGDRLELAIGSGGGTQLARFASIEEDPRAFESQFYGILGRIAEPGSELLWINLRQPGWEAIITSIPQRKADQLIIAIAGEDAEQRRKVNLAIVEHPGTLPRPAMWFYDVDARFKTLDEWLEYLRSLPVSRPDDLWIRIGVDGVQRQLREGQYDFVEPWHLMVLKVFRRGIPGDPSQFAIVRQQGALTKAHVIDSLQAVASGAIRFERPPPR